MATPLQRPTSLLRSIRGNTSEVLSESNGIGMVALRPVIEAPPFVQLTSEIYSRTCDCLEPSLLVTM